MRAADSLSVALTMLVKLPGQRIGLDHPVVELFVNNRNIEEPEHVVKLVVSAGYIAKVKFKVCFGACLVALEGNK
jgi:hypothetical protein